MFISSLPLFYLEVFIIGDFMDWSLVSLNFNFLKPLFNWIARNLNALNILFSVQLLILVCQKLLFRCCSVQINRFYHFLLIRFYVLNSWLRVSIHICRKITILSAISLNCSSIFFIYKFLSITSLIVKCLSILFLHFFFFLLKFYSSCALIKVTINWLPTIFC
jgi:hypothetical protein